MIAVRQPKPKPIDIERLDDEQLADLAVQLNGRPVPGVRWSEKRFVDWSFGQRLAEWSDGEVILVPPVSDAHDDLDTLLISVLRQFVEIKRLGVIRHKMFVRLPRRRRVPDLLFVAEARRSIIAAKVINGPPDLAIEIVSSDSQDRDRRVKFLEYESAGVREYWIIDPLSQTLQAFRLRGKRYVEIQPDGEAVHSTVLPGFHLRNEWLFGKRMPTVADVLKALGAY